MDSAAFQSAIDDGLTTGGWQALENWTLRESSFYFKDGPPDAQPFNQQVFGCLIDLLQNDAFLSDENASIALSVFESDWSSLTSSQKSILLSNIVEAYSSFRDPIAWFTIAEIIGEYFANEEAFFALMRLKTTPEEEPRSLIPMGFEQIVRHSSRELAAKAFSEIIKMRQDESEQVRMEVDISLNRLASQDLLPFLRQEEQE